TAAGNTLAQAERLGQRPSWWVPASALGSLGLQGGELVDLGLQGSEAGLEGGHLGGRRAVLVVVDDVLGRVPDVGLEVLGPVEQVIDEVLGVVDDVFQEAGEGVLALGHDDQALAPASCSSASWLTLAVSSARAEWRPATSVDETDFSSSSTTSVTASFMSVSTSLARSRMSSTKSLVSTTMSSMNRVRVFLRLAMGPSLGSVGPCQPPVFYAVRNITRRVSDVKGAITGFVKNFPRAVSGGRAGPAAPVEPDGGQRRAGGRPPPLLGPGVGPVLVAGAHAHVLAEAHRGVPVGHVGHDRADLAGPVE